MTKTFEKYFVNHFTLIGKVKTSPEVFSPFFQKKASVFVIKNILFFVPTKTHLAPL